MSSELLEDLAERRANFRKTNDYLIAYGLKIAIDIVKQHEAKQMKEPFYQLTEEQQNRLERLRRKRQFVVSPCIYDSWAIEQEREEEK